MTTTYPTVNIRKKIKDASVTMPVEIKSHYKIDYLIMQYETIIDEENRKTLGECDGDVNFIKFMDLVKKFRSKVDADRLSHGQDTATGFADYRDYLTGVDFDYNGTPVLELLQEDLFMLMNEYHYIINDGDKCCADYNTPIVSNQFHVRWNKNFNDGMWGALGAFGLGRKIFNFYFHNFDVDLSGQNIDKLRKFLLVDSIDNPIAGFTPSNGSKLNELISAIELAWQTYLSTSISIKKPTEFGFDILKTELDNTTKNVNQIIQSADYQKNYEVLQQTIEKSAILLKQLANGSFIESTIIKGTNDSKQNDILIFDKNDMNSSNAVIVPVKSSVDLVSGNEILKATKKKIEAMEDDITGDTSAAVLGATLSSDLTSESPTVMDNIYNFLETINKNKKIFGTEKQLESLYLLMNATIFKADKNKPASIIHFDNKKKKDLETAIVDKHTKILDTIITGPSSKLEQFKTAYPAKQLQAGGSDISSTTGFNSGKDFGDKFKSINKPEKKVSQKYKFKKQSGQVATSQTGGHRVDFIEYKNDAGETLNLIESLEEKMELNHNKIIELDNIFFENKESFDLNVMEQRNELLIELETLINVTIFIIKLGSDEHKNFGSELQIKIKDFSGNLTNMWKEMRKRVKITGATDDTLLDELLKKGSMNVGDLQDYFSKEGLTGIVVPMYPKQVAFGQMPFINAIEGLTKSLSSIDNAAKQLRALTSKGINISNQKHTVEEIYTQLYTYYSESKNIGINIEVARKQVENNEIDLDKLKKSASEVIESHITTANFFMNSMLLTITAYDAFATSMGDLISEINKTKNRIDNFEIYLAIMKKTCTKYENPIYSKLDKTIDLGYPFIDAFSIEKTYDNYNKYVTDSQSVVKRLIPNLDYQKNLITLNGKYKELTKRVENLLILGKMLHFDTSLPNLVHSYDIMVGSDLIDDTKIRIEDIEYVSNQISENTDKKGITGKSLLENIYIDNQITTQTELTTAIMDLYFNLFGNKTYYLYFYPELIKKLNIPNEIQKIIDMFMYPNTRIFEDERKILNKIIKKLGAVGDITDHNKFISVLTIYFELSIDYYTKKSNILDIPTDIEINRIQKLWEKIDPEKMLKDTDYTPAVNLINEIANIPNNNIPEKSIKNKISEYIQGLYSKSVFYFTKDEAGFCNYMVEKINIIPISIYQTYYSELNSFYILSTTYLSSPGGPNPNFDNIINKQKGIRKMGVNLQNIKMSSIYKTYTIPPTTVTDDFRTTLDAYDPSYGSPGKTSFDEDHKLMSKISGIKPIFNQFISNTVDIFDFFSQQPTDKLLPTLNNFVGINFTFNPAPLKRLYQTAQTVNAFYGLKCPISETTLLTEDIPTYDRSTGAKKFKIGNKLISMNITYNIAPNTPITPELLSNYSITIRIINVILDVFPSLLLLKEKLYELGTNTAIYNDLHIDGDNVSKQKVKNDLKSYLLIFQEKIDAKIRNNKDIALLNSILLPSQIEFQKAITYLNSIPIGSITWNSLENYFVKTYCFLSGLTSFYISYLYPILKQIFQPEIFTCIKDNIIAKQMENININKNIKPLLDLSKLYDPYYKSISSVTSTVTSDLQKTFNKITKDINPVTKTDVPTKDTIYDIYYDNISTITPGVYPYSQIVIMAKDNKVPVIMEKIDKLWTEIAHIDLFSRNIDPNIKELEKYIDNKIIAIDVADWKKDDVFKTGLGDIIREFKKVFLNGPSSNRQKNIDILNKKNTSYDFNDTLKEIININHFDTQCFDDMILESADKTNLPHENYIINDTDWYDKLSKVHPNNWKEWILYPYDDKQIYHKNMGRLYRDFKNNHTTTPIKTVLDNVLSAKIYEYTNGIRYFIEKKLEELGKLYAEINYKDLYDKMVENIDILKKNSTLLAIGQYVENNTAIHLTNVFKAGYNSVSKGTPINPTDIQMIYRMNLNDNPTSWLNTPIDKDILNSFSMLREFSSKIQSNIHDNLQIERTVVEKSIKLNYGLTNHLEKDKNIITNRLRTMDSMMNILNKVMFNIYFRDTSLMGSAKLWDRLTEIGQTYKRIGDMIESKMYSIIEHQRGYILELSRQKNYMIFTNAIGKQIGNEIVDAKIYKQMSFALIKLYRDILKIILECINGKPIEDLSEVNKYLSKRHFIVLNRCYKLFNWITEEYVEPAKEAQRKLQLDALMPGSTKTFDPLKSILKKKVQLFLTTGPIKQIFIEFNAIRDMLDKYKILVMPSVSVFLRINDWKSGISGDYDPQTIEYDKMWKEKKLLFQNDDDSNPDSLQVYFENIPGGNIVDLQTKNEAITAKMANTKDSGIKFQTICNSVDYPDPDVIANQMATGPLILDGKGIMLLTYGYSGIGKSDTLFGRWDPQSKQLKSPGMLQATLDQMPDGADIYFRVYELYGLGTQFDFYWNPKDNTGNPECFPDFYQLLIHHRLKETGPLALHGTDSHIVFTNRTDMLSYIMDLKQPGPNPDPTIQKTKVQLQQGANIGETTKSRHKSLQPGQGNANSTELTFDTYRKITRDEYENFSEFVKETIDLSQRKRKGVEFTQILTHTLKQVKPTINNPDSSRSILIYDFQIRKAGTNIFTPFLIYDLPGKEDLFGTYVNPNQTSSTDPEKIAGSFKDIPRDTSDIKVRKANYVMNPFMACVFDDNITKAINYFTGDLAFTNGVKFIEDDLIKEILQSNLNYLTMDTPGLGGRPFDLSDGSPGFTMGDFYNLPAPKTFKELFKLTTTDPKNPSTIIDPSFVKDTYRTPLTNSTFTPYIKQSGGPGAILYKLFDQTNKISITDMEKNIYLIVTFSLIYILIKHKYFDVIVGLINELAGSHTDPGGWNTTKIYAFFEAFYINENISGILHYLLSDPKIVNKSSGFKLQPNFGASALETYSKQYKSYFVYKNILNYEKFISKGKISVLDLPTIKVPDEFIPDNPNMKRYPFEIKNMEDFLTKYRINKNLTFITTGMAIQPTTTKLVETYEAILYRQNKELYQSSAIFRNGIIGKTSLAGCGKIADPNTIDITYADPKFDITTATTSDITNIPLIQEFIDPYKPKIDNYYIFYLITNTTRDLKGEKQIELLNTSIEFIEAIGVDKKKNLCA